MEADEVVEVLELLDRAGVTVWVLGGWGVDALVGHQTRGHSDLDILVLERELRTAQQALRVRSFTLGHVWPESRPLDADEEGSEGKRPTAFVLGHPDGRLLDVYVLGLDEDGAPVPLWRTGLPMSWRALGGRGTIGERSVRCFTAEMQLACHEGYVLPAEHARDVGLLRELLGRD